MNEKELMALRLLIDNPQGLYGSEFIPLSGGKLSRSAIYLMLERLVEMGYVREIEEPESPSSGVVRTRHFITEQGRAIYDSIAKQGEPMTMFQLTSSEKRRLVIAAKAAVAQHNVPYAIFCDSSGKFRVERWNGTNYGGGPIILVLPSWIEVAE